MKLKLLLCSSQVSSSFEQNCLSRNIQMKYFTVIKDVYFHYQLWNKPFTMLSAEWQGVSNKGMFMLSIMGRVVIKTHFSSNECKLAHLLWWTSCPDSSISVIDQLSSCWWLTGNGSWGAFKGEVQGWKSSRGKKRANGPKQEINKSFFFFFKFRLLF